MSSKTMSGTGSASETRAVGGWLGLRVLGITVAELAAQLIRPRALRPAAGCLASIVVVVAVIGLSLQAARTGEQLRLTGLGTALVPALALAMGSVWAYLVLWRVLTASGEIVRHRRRLAFLPVPGPLSDRMSYLPVMLPLAAATAAAAIPVTVLFATAAPGTTAVLVPLLVGISLSSVAFLLARWVCAALSATRSPRPVRDPDVAVGPVALSLLIIAYVAGVRPLLTEPAADDPVGSPASLDIPPEVDPINPVLMVLAHQGPWDLWQVGAALLGAMTPVILIARFDPAALRTSQASSSRVVRHRPQHRTTGPVVSSRFPGLAVVGGVGRLVLRTRALRTDFVVCIAVGLLIAYLATVLDRQDRAGDTALFAFWAAVFPALGLATFRAGLGPTQRLLGTGLRPRELVLGLTIVLLLLWTAGSMPSFVLLAAHGSDVTLLVRHLLLSLGATVLLGALATLTRSVALTSTGRGLTVGTAMVVLILALASGAAQVQTPVLVLATVGALIGWLTITALSTRSSTLD